MAINLGTLPPGVRSIETEFFWICECCGYSVPITSTRNKLHGYCPTCEKDNRPLQRYQRVTTEVICDGV